MGLTRVVIKFDLSSIPQDSKIKACSLLLHFFDSTDWKGTGDILAFQLTTPWKESGTLPDWNNIWNKSGGDFDSTRLDGTGRGTGLGWSTLTMNTEVIQSMVENPETNYGFILIPCRDPGLHWFGGKLHLSEAGYTGAYGGSESNGKFAPKLEVTYDNSTEITPNKFSLSHSKLKIKYQSKSINIQCNNSIERVSVFSMQGKVLSQVVPSTISDNITIPFNRVGVFSLVVKGQKGLVVKKIYKH